MKSEDENIIEEAHRLLTPNGWNIQLVSAETEFALELSHELTTPTVLGFLRSGGDNLQSLRRMVERREFGTIERRPADTPHAPLIRAFRESAGANGWDPSVLAIVARVLATHGLLTESEAEWLAEAGAAWSN
jgi:hypothetical protein